MERCSIRPRRRADPRSSTDYDVDVSRPKNADSAATYDRIVRAARTQIRDEGIDAFSLRGVAVRADSSLGSVTYYFGNRQGLIEACLEDGYRWLESRARARLKAVLSGSTLRSQVEIMAREVFRRARDDRELLRARILDTMQRGELGERLEKELLPMLDLVSTALGRGEVARRLRFSVHTFELMIGRYAVHTDEELCRIADHDTIEGAVAATEDHIAQLAMTLFESAVSGTPLAWGSR